MATKGMPFADSADNGDDASGIDWCDSDCLRAFGNDVLNRIYLAGECALRRGSGNNQPDACIGGSIFGPLVDQGPTLVGGRLCNVTNYELRVCGQGEYRG